MIKIHVVSLSLDESLRFLSCLGRDPRSLKTWARHPVSPHPGVTFNCMCKPQEEIMRFLGFVHHPTPGNVSGNEGLAGRLGPQGITIWRELPGASCFSFSSRRGMGGGEEAWSSPTLKALLWPLRVEQAGGGEKGRAWEPGLADTIMITVAELSG